MGMFDTLFVHPSLIDKLLEENGVDLESFDGYYSFQTKDLDNYLSSFYLDEDGSFTEERQNHKWIEGEEDAEFPRHLGSYEPIGDPEYIVDNRKAYIMFYDSVTVTSKGERIWIDFLAHVKDGKLTEPISVKNIERIDLKKEAVELKKARERTELIRSTFEFQVADFIFRSKYKLMKLFNPIIRFINELESFLRKKAEKKVDEHL